MNRIVTNQNRIHSDERGSFVRIFDNENPDLHGFEVVQSNLSVNPSVGTLRGMHYQVTGPDEHKLVTVIKGSIHMNIVDLRVGEMSNSRVASILLNSHENSILIPSGHATGWISLEEDTTLLYQMSARFEDCTYSGFRFDDPVYSLEWPLTPNVISAKDLDWPLANGENIF